MTTHHKIIIGDSRRMTDLADESVHLVVTSPPYWQLKDYGNTRQIGFHDSYEEYINNLNLVWQESCRVLHNGCRMCINIGDQFARSVYYGRYKVIPIRTEITRFCETIGMDYMGAIIWQKVTTTNTTGGATIMGSFPYPRNGILKIDYEFILIFKKQGKPPKVGKEVKDRSKLSTDDWNTYFAGHWKFAGEKQDKHLAMFPLELPHRLIRMFSFVDDTVLDPFSGSGTTSLAARNLNRNSVGYEINKDFIPVIKNKLKINQKNILKDAAFKLVIKPQINLNFIPALAELPYKFHDPHKLDKYYTPKKAEIIPPAALSNTSNGVVIPAKTGRIPPATVTNKTQTSVIPAKTGRIPPATVTNKTQTSVIPAKAGIYPLKGKPNPFQKNYGSKISVADPGDRTEYFSVKEIISPEIIRLGNGSTVLLLGIKEDPAYREQAMKFLGEKTRSNKVYLKFDKVKHDMAGNLLAYVYLKNRTFLNAHLIKTGFVRVETNRDFKYKDKFLHLFSETGKKRRLIHKTD